MENNNLQIGLNGRFFPKIWRPALQEIEFAKQNGFAAMQFQGKVEGLKSEMLGAPLAEIGQALANGRITAVMEIVIRLHLNGKTAEGLSPTALLEANLPAIVALGCRCVHWHMVPAVRMGLPEIRQLEQQMVPQLAQGVAIAQQEEFRLGFEHNEPRLALFAPPAICASTLDALPNLGLVWDINHTTEDDMPAFEALIPRMTMLHVADTPLPEVNHHLPLGQGNIDFTAVCRALHEGGFAGPAILEVGGLPKSGGYGQDTDEALIQSLRLLHEVNQSVLAAS